MEKSLKEQVAEIGKKLEELKEKKANDRAYIARRITEERMRVELAQSNLDKAIRDMDEKAYKKYNAEVTDARTNLELYEERNSQINNIEYVTEGESDEVFNTLLKYEDALQADFEEKFVAALQELKKIYEPYFDEVYETELILRSWEKDIKPNFRYLRKDENGNYYGNRADHPVSIHFSAYIGSERADKLRNFVEGCEDDRIVF